jgi:hypothetical protein
MLAMDVDPHQVENALGVAAWVNGGDANTHMFENA